MATAAHPGSGPLTARGVVNDAIAMLRQSFWRIAGVAIVFFALPAVVAVSAEAAIESAGPTDSLLVFSAALVALVVAASLRVLGPVAFAGFLDEAVAKEYVHGHHTGLREVLHELPWRPLIVADVIVVVVVGVGLAFFAVPGLIAFGGIGLVGPVIVQERAGVNASFRRTIGLARLVPLLVAFLVVLPFAVEEIVHALMFETLHSSGIGIQIAAEWILAIVLGGTLGLLEVALATELIARYPRAQDVPDATETPVELLEDGQAPTV